MEFEKLLRSCRAGDERAWTALVKGCERLVYSIPNRYRLSEEDASDVFMATFQLLYQNLDRIEHAVTLPRWLAVTASRECLRLIRNRKVDASTSLDLESVIASEERSAEKNAILAVQSEEVRNGLDALDARCRRLLGLLYLDEEDPRYDEISEKLGMPIGAIGPTRARCLEKLRKILVSRGFEP